MNGNTGELWSTMVSSRLTPIQYPGQSVSGCHWVPLQMGWNFNITTRASVPSRMRPHEWCSSANDSRKQSQCNFCSEMIVEVVLQTVQTTRKYHKVCLPKVIPVRFTVKEIRDQQVEDWYANIQHHAQKDLATKDRWSGATWCQIQNLGIVYASWIILASGHQVTPEIDPRRPTPTHLVQRHLLNHPEPLGLRNATTTIWAPNGTKLCGQRIFQKL